MAATILATILSDLPYMEVDTAEHAQKWSFVALGEDEMMKKCFITAWKFPLQEGFFPRPKWREVVLDRCFSYCNVKKKIASHPLSAWWKSRWWECSPTCKKAGVCAIMSIWLVHIKEHVWTVGTCPTTTLLPDLSCIVCIVL